MKAILMNGPRDMKVIENMPAGQMLWREAIPREVTMADMTFDPLKAKPMYDIAAYQFTGLATVNGAGEIGAVIYRFTGME